MAVHPAKPSEPSTQQRHSSPDEIGSKHIPPPYRANKLLLSIPRGCYRPPFFLQQSLPVRHGIGVNVIVLTLSTQSIESINLLRPRRVPSNVRNALVVILESCERPRQKPEASRFGVFFGAIEKGLHADANSKKWLAGLDVLLDGLGVAALGNLGEAVAEVADAGDYEFLGAKG